MSFIVLCFIIKDFCLFYFSSWQGGQRELARVNELKGFERAQKGSKKGRREKRREYNHFFPSFFLSSFF